MFPTLERFDRVAFDTETTGVGFRDRPVGISWSTPDGQSGYERWGHERGGNSCTLDEVKAWFHTEVVQRPLLKKLWFNAFFDLRMLVLSGIVGPELFPGIEDAAVCAPLINEHKNSYTLDRLAKDFLGEEKDDTFLNEWCAAQFGGAATRTAQAGNYWRAPGDIVEAYACGDTELTLHLYDHLRPMITAQGLERIYGIETALIPIVVRMYLTGVRIDPARANEVRSGRYENGVMVEPGIEQQLSIARERWLEIAAGAGVTMDDGWILPGTAQVVPVFQALGIPYGRTKPSKRFPQGQDSVTVAHLEASDHEAATVLLALRQNTKLQGTFVDTIIRMGGDEGIIHGEFNPLMVEYVPGKKYGTVSGRFSAKLLHQIPGERHPEVGRLIRSLFVPYYDEGQWFKADYSQIEYRFMAHYAGGIVAQKYNEPLPTHCAKCAGPLDDGECYVCEIDYNIDFHNMVRDLVNNPDLNRTKIKNVNFGELYGMGLNKGALTAGVTLEAWKAIKKLYHEKTGGVIGALKKKVEDAADDRGYIITWGGRRCRFFSAAEARAMNWKVHPREKHVGTYKSLNSLLQGSAGDLNKYAMVKVCQDLVDWQTILLHLTVHDELDFTGPKGDAGVRFKKQLKESMTDWTNTWGAQRLNVPIRVKIGTGPDWGHAKE